MKYKQRFSGQSVKKTGVNYKDTQLLTSFLFLRWFLKKVSGNLWLKELLSYAWFKEGIPILFGTRDHCHGRQFFHELQLCVLRGRGWFWDDSVHYIYCVLYFCYYYTVIYKERLTQLTIMQSQWEPWSCFLATRHPVSGWWESDGEFL